MDDKWAYKTQYFGTFDNKIDKVLNDLGQQGWEAVGISPASALAGTQLGIFVLLKKPWVSVPPKPDPDNEAGLRLKQIMKEREG